MRSWIVLAGILPMLAACGASVDEHDANAAAADYRPPTVTSRLDFGGQIERRFHRLDADLDDKLSSDELPERIRPALSRWDRTGDGMLDSEEWGAMLLAWFDRNDANKDGSLTSAEIAAGREKREAEARGSAGPAR